MNIRKLYKDDNHAFQQLTYTCGPVALLNLLRQQGDDSHTEEELAKLCKASRKKGTRVKHLVKAAEKLGFEVVESRANATTEDIEHHLDQGHKVIVDYFYAFAEEGHFAQIAEYDDVAFYFIDPSLGYMRLKKPYFIKNWHNQNGKLVGWFMAVK